MVLGVFNYKNKNKPMIRLISHHMPIDDFEDEESIQEKIWKEQRNISKKALERFHQDYVTSRDTACTLIEVRDELIARGVAESSLSHAVGNFSDKLEVSINQIVYELNIPLFPKRKAGRGIDLHTGKIGVKHDFEITTSPASIAEFLIALSDWMPEYLSIEERITGEEIKKNIACDIAMDLLKKKFDDILAIKGYQYDIDRPRGSNIAILTISIDKAVTMIFRIDLLEDFLVQLTRIIEAL